jgi:hypothetical protein
MRFTELDLLCACSHEVIHIDFRDKLNAGPYILKSVLGLDLDSIVPKYSGRSSNGKNFYSPTIPKREVVVRFALKPNYAEGETPDSLRDNVYKALATNRTGVMSLLFKRYDAYEDESIPVAKITGSVKRIEASIFAETPEIQITLDCQDPFLRSPEATVFPAETFASLDHVAGDTTLVLNDEVSTAPHGMTMEFLCTATRSSFVISNALPHPWMFELIPGTINGITHFVSGDRIFIDNSGSTSQVYVMRGGVPVHLMDKIRPGSVWPTIFPGDNNFTIARYFKLESVSWFSSYWGI